MNKRIAMIAVNLAGKISLAAALMGGTAHAASTLEVKEKAVSDIQHVVEPILSQYCREQCKIIHIDSEVDLAVADEALPGFEEQTGKATIAPASGKVQILMDENLGSQTRDKIVNLVKEHLKVFNFPVTIDSTYTRFPQPAASSYRVADLREKVTKDIKNSLKLLLSQFCPDMCELGDFDVQSESVNPEDVDYSSSQEYFQDGPAAIRVRGVKATIIVDQDMPVQEANGILEMARLKVAAFKNSTIGSQVMKFPKPIAKGDGTLGKFGNGYMSPWNQDANNKNNNLTSDSKFNTSENKVDSKTEKSDHAETRTNSSTNNNVDSKTLNHAENKDEKKSERFEHYEKIERVENGDAVQQTLEKFRMYGIIFAAVMLALLITLIVVNTGRRGRDSKPGKFGNEANPFRGIGSQESTMSDDKASLLAKRVEADRLFNELTNVFSEHPKVAKYVFGQVLTEEGVEVTAQYLQIFGESVVMDLLRDPALQADLSELMDFYARNAFELNDDERLVLLKKLHHRTVSGKMMVHGSRSAVLFDFLVEMDTPQIAEMIRNESSTVKAIVLTQCDQKKRHALFNTHDEATRLKLMTELSRIDHLPKNYIHNVASALRRKKAENPKLNTEALPGTDVLVSFLEKANVETQRTIIHQLMNTSGMEALHNLKSKLASLETLRFMKDAQVTDVITHIKHDEVVQFLKGCSAQIHDAVLSKAPQDLADEIRDALSLAPAVSREAYSAVERKVLNRIKVLANQGELNLAEVNERMFAEEFGYQDLREVA